MRPGRRRPRSGTGDSPSDRGRPARARAWRRQGQFRARTYTGPAAEGGSHGASDVHLVFLQPADALPPSASGQADAWAIWDPTPRWPSTTQVRSYRRGGRQQRHGFRHCFGRRVARCQAQHRPGRFRPARGPGIPLGPGAPAAVARKVRCCNRNRSGRGSDRAIPKPTAGHPPRPTRCSTPSSSWPTCSLNRARPRTNRPFRILWTTDSAMGCRNSGTPPNRRRINVPAKFFWFLPTNGDSRSIVGASHASAHHTTPAGYREPSLRYLGEIARAAERLGFEGVLTPTGTWCEDAWLTSAALLAQTERLKFLVAFRPGLVSPTLAAQQAATFQRLSGGRLLLNVVTGGDDVEQRRFGDWLEPRRALRAHRRVPAASSRQLWRGEPVDFTRATTTTSTTRGSLRRRTVAPDSTSAARHRPRCRRGAEHADVYLTWGEPPGRGRPKDRDSVRELAKAARARAAVRHPAARDRRDTSEEAWARGQDAARRARPRTAIAQAHGAARAVPVGGPAADDRAARRAAATRSRSTRTCGRASAWCAAARAPRWWAATRRWPTRIAEYHALGIDEFILSGYPHLEEAYWFGEGVLPCYATRRPGCVGQFGTPARLRIRRTHAWAFWACLVDSAQFPV